MRCALRSVFSGILIGAALFGWSDARADGTGAIDFDLAAKFFAQAKLISEQDGGRLWGVPLYGPILFVDPGSRQVVANQADVEGLLVPRGNMHVGSLPLEQNIANTAVRWAGVHWTMIMWPLPENRYQRGKLMAHEMFHRIQDQVGLGARDADNTHLDTAEGRIWMRLEWRALTEALIGADAGRRQAIEDALLFRAVRRASFPDAAAPERGLELNEGLAEYTGFCAGGWPVEILADRAAVQAEDYEARPAIVRNFAYASGPAYGILLDESGASWRRGLTTDSDLGELLRSALNIELAGVSKEEALRRIGKYGGEAVVKQETERETRRKQRQAAFKARFVDGPTLTLPRVGEIRYSFNPNGVEAFGEVGTVYITTRVTDEWGVLDVTADGALMIRDGAVVGRFIVPASEGSDLKGTSFKGAGWTLELNDGWALKVGKRSGDYVVARH
ncbi:MAG: hypothetical protein L0Y44_03275 [Phycisphaerales bacterium]|nr:hypothetical protein [Phycisphaerales bacterium]MCI0629657.1 hypothetical protein [Phycisphaerales bacterium]MCI0674587.1 hypothetical protein [Phycisphaerales bacterium]